MPGYDPRFWELPFDPGDMDALPGSLLDAPGDESEPSGDPAARKAALEAIGELARTGLTDRQREIVRLYFYDGRTQVEIATELGISQQVVSRQLFGVVREGRRIGGAIARLRKACVALGIDPEQWV
jgi:DNA-directed RNA polymerase specialized sigma24 family protein